MSVAQILTIQKDGETIRSQSVEGEISIGRAEGNVIRLNDRAISRQHAVLRALADGLQIEKRSDFGAISVNGADCTRAVVKTGDVIAIGPYLIKVEAGKKSPEPAAALSAMPDLSPAPSEPASPVLPEVEVIPAARPAVDATVVLPDALGIAEEAPSDAPAEDLMSSTPEPLGLETPIVSPIEPEGSPAEDPLALDMNGIFDQNPLDAGGAAEGGPMEVALNGGDFLSTSESSEAEKGTGLILGMDSSSEDTGKTRVQSVQVEAKLILLSGTATPAELEISKSEVSIGRGKNCDIVIADKKTSRRNTLIVKEGVRYIIRDLGSSNGTYVNGKSVQEKVLSAEDKIRIGECEFHFMAVNPHFEKQAKDFMTVPELEPTTSPLASPLAPDMGAVYPFGQGPATAGASSPGGLGVPQQQQPSERKGIWKIYDKYIRNFKTLKPAQKLLVVLVGALFILWYFEEEPVDMNQAQNADPAAAQKAEGPAGNAKGTKALTPEQRQFVDTQYNLAFEFYTKKDYDKALYDVQKIFPLAPEHERAKELERYILEAKRMRDAIEAEQKKKEEEARLKVRIASLKEEIQDLMQKGRYEEARERFSEILEIDPEDSNVAEWRAQIDAFFEEQARVAQEKRVQDEINKAALDTFNEANDLQKAERFHDAIKVYTRVGEMGSSDRSLLAKAKARVKTCLDEISERRDPLLEKARNLEKEGNLAGAFREYENATRVDPPHPDGYAGMDRVRGVLTEQAKALYTEAVIAESYSDFKVAYQKFKEILEMAPQGSVYFDRAQRKIATYKHFKPDEEPEIP